MGKKKKLAQEVSSSISDEMQKVQNELFDLREVVQIRDFKSKNKAQEKAHKVIRDFTITFLIGEAGTAKTFLAVDRALRAWKDGEVDKIFITRPAVVADEDLGYLPGNLDEKLLPFMLPLYDIFEYLVGKEHFEAMRMQGIITICPLGHMRGRTLHRAFLILDESQNATPKQMKLALTRLGHKSKAVVTMDPKQSDLPDHAESAADEKEIARFMGRDGIAVFDFYPQDVVRSKIVQTVVECYGD